MKRLQVFLLAPGLDDSSSQSYPQHQIHQFLFIIMGGKRHCESDVSYLRKQHNVPGQRPILECSKMFSCPERHSKIFNFVIAELFYSHIHTKFSGAIEKQIPRQKTQIARSEGESTNHEVTTLRETNLMSSVKSCSFGQFSISITQN